VDDAAGEGEVSGANQPQGGSGGRFDFARRALHGGWRWLLTGAMVCAIASAGWLVSGPAGGAGGPLAAPTSEAAAQAAPVSLQLPIFDASLAFDEGVLRFANGHTQIPRRPRVTILKYRVKAGDTLFGIADRYGLKPESIFWGNFEVLNGDPHSLSPGQDLAILPTDGAAYEWKAGDSLQAVADSFGVDPQAIIDWPGNNLPPDADPVNPSISDGTLLVIPGGKREFVDWRSPRITRSNPATASLLGPGACPATYTGAIGSGTFVWPTSSKWISGYNYIPGVHEAIDIGGSVGNAIFASDSGVVVYAGWHNGGYGYVAVIDHGNGWQTLYAHLSALNVGCGDSVYQGGRIGAMGCTGNCTGPHLHFEMMSDLYGKVNPLNFLP
jgi:murein DD-endopeptidase MepM/ murein hydrolase activator NlpD